MGKSFKENPGKYGKHKPTKKKHGRAFVTEPQPDEDWHRLNDIRHGHGSDRYNTFDSDTN